MHDVYYVFSNDQEKKKCVCVCVCVEGKNGERNNVKILLITY